MVLDYFFHKLRYQKVTVSVLDFNEASPHLHVELGFQREGRPRRMTCSGGMFHDHIMSGLTAEEFARRWQPGGGAA